MAKSIHGLDSAGIRNLKDKAIEEFSHEWNLRTNQKATYFLNLILANTTMDKGQSAKVVMSIYDDLGIVIKNRFLEENNLKDWEL